MEFEQLNFQTLIIFLFLLWFFSVLIYFYFKKIKNTKILIFKNRTFVKEYFLIISFVLVLFTIFSPKYWELKSSWESKWIDVVFALDVSKSMNVADIKDSHYNYTRLDIIKQAISRFVVKHIENRYWLVVFAWDAVSSVPLTLDHDVFLTILKWVDYRNVFKQGTDIKQALKLALNRFNYNDNRSKAIVLITDWADKDYIVDTNYLKSLKRKYKNVKFFVVWVWTDKWWMIIKWRDPFWDIVYQKYKWRYVISKINRTNLRLIAWALDAPYIEINNVNDLLKLNKYFSSLQKKVLEYSSNWEKNNLIRFFIILSFIFFNLYLLLYFYPNIYKKLWIK